MSKRIVATPKKQDETARFVLATGRHASWSPVVAQHYGARDYTVRRLLAAGDAVGLTVGLGTMLLSAAPRDALRQMGFAVFTLPVWIAILKAYGLYDRDIKRISHTSVDDLPGLAHAVLVGTLLMWLYFHVMPGGGRRFGDVVLFSIVSICVMTVLRVLIRRVIVKALGPERVIFVGDDKMVSILARKMRAHPEYGLKPIGCVTPSIEHGGPDCARGDVDEALPCLGELGRMKLAELVARHRVERLVISHSNLDNSILFELLRDARPLYLKVSLLPQLFDALGPSVEVDDVEGITVLGINPSVLSPSSRFLKRVVDIAGASVALTVCAPLLCVIAIAIKLDSSGPVFFRQERVGRNGQRFRLLKFRSMIADAELHREQLLAQSRDPHWLDLEHDPRITRLGRRLRLASLDELPQLVNVLRGEMSLVGPRPLPVPEDRRVSGWGRNRLDLTPGLTGLWQVLGRTNIPFDEMIKLDYLYVTNWSLWTDVRLIMRTVPVVFARRGAN